MALSPISPKRKTSSIDESIKSAEKSSLLYQLIGKLLLSPNQEKPLSDSLKLSVNTDLVDHNHKIINSLLMLRLSRNEHFISELSRTKLQSIELNDKNVEPSTENNNRIVQFSDYQKSDGPTTDIVDL